MRRFTFIIIPSLLSFLGYSHDSGLRVESFESAIISYSPKPNLSINSKKEAVIEKPLAINNRKGHSSKSVQCSVPTPTAIVVTQPTCAIPTGTIQVTSPNSSTSPTFTNLFISEVTDAETGSLTYVEIYNGTGVSKDLSNYKLKIYNNGNATPSCDLSLSGILPNNSVNVVKVSSDPNQGGVVANQTFPGCGGVNTDDNIRLTTSSDVLIDNWGRKDGVNFTPLNSPGYVYRRLATANPIPNTGWNPSDWEIIDPEDYSNVGIYTAFNTVQYSYNVDGGTYQTSPIFSGLASGNHIITAMDTTNGGCISSGITVSLNTIITNTPVTTFSYTTPVCSNATATLTPTSAVGFVTGGTYTASGLIIDATTGVVDLVNSTPATYVITYSVNANSAACLSAGSSQFTLVINPLPTVAVNSQSICQGQLANIAATPGIGGAYTYTWTSPVGATSLGNVAGFDTLIPGIYTVKITDVATGCASASASGTVNLIPAPMVTVDDQTVCQGQSTTVIALPESTGNYSYVWTTPLGVTNPGNVATFNTTTAGAYSVVITDTESGCSSQSASGTVSFVSSFDFSINKDCKNNNFTLEVIPSEGAFDDTTTTFDWQYNNVSVGSGPTFNVTAYLNSTTEVEQLPLGITVNVTSAGCQQSHTITLESVFCDIQKGISPNGDGLNDSFDLHLLGVNKASIFNRYGTKVYSKTDYVNEWVGQTDNGNELPDGTYYYVLEFKNNNSNKAGWIYINRETK